MAKVKFSENQRTAQVFNDLEAFLEFCVEYGYKYDEASLYDQRTYSYQQFLKYQAKKQPKDQWAEDSKRFNRTAA